MCYSPVRMCSLGVLLTLLIGCSQGPPMAEVEGILKDKKGKPLDKIQIEFWPEGNGPRSIGETDSEGKYSLSSDNGRLKGALVGTHKIVLRDLKMLGDKFYGRAGENIDISKGKKSRVAKIYDDPHKTPIKKTVNAGKNKIDLDL